MDNVQGPRGSGASQPKGYNWFGGRSLFLVHGPPRVLPRHCIDLKDDSFKTTFSPSVKGILMSHDQQCIY